MARKVDEEQKTARRREIAEAVSRVMARKGAGLAGLRDIARELNCTVGVLTHQFKNKDELYLFSWRYLVGELFGDALAAAGDATGLERLERILVATLPITAEREQRWRQWMAFIGGSVAHGPMAEEEIASNIRFLNALEGELRGCIESGCLPPDLDVSAEARVLMSLVDGLAIDAVIHPDLYPAGEQTAAVRRHLGRLSRG